MGPAFPFVALELPRSFPTKPPCRTETPKITTARFFRARDAPYSPRADFASAPRFIQSRQVNDFFSNTQRLKTCVSHYN